MKTFSLQSRPFHQRLLAVPGQLARKAVFRTLGALRHGRLALRESGREWVFGDGDMRWPAAEVDVVDAEFFTDMMLGGSLGAAEAYMRGHWTTPDLTAVVRMISRNMDVLEKMEGGLAVLALPFRKGWHYLRRNTRRGSRENISAHYDLSNDFFKRWLDPTMMYSSAIWPRNGASLDEAATFKLDRICKKLDLKPNNHVVEIGTGWGGFAIYAAKHYGCRVTTTTISQEQHDWAEAAIESEGLSNRITLLLKDYRDLEGRFDKLVSIEMIEAVGHHYFADYFRTCSRLLKDDGMMLIQAITMPDQRYRSARDEVDFIKRYIFPGSCIPSIGIIQSTIGKETDLQLFHMESITEHYARTLAAWRDNVMRHRDEIIDHFSETFLRMWNYYLSYCEGGFAERVIGCAQLRFAKPWNRAV